MTGTLWTIGHSNHSWEHFLSLLLRESIQILVDVRRFPGSRKHPQFSGEAMADALRDAGIGYEHLEGLGGRRARSEKASRNTAWRVASFNYYADHTATDEFQSALQRLLYTANHQRTAMMCAEALPWRCHRRIIADVLLARGWTVLHIMDRGAPRPHTLPDFARVTGEDVTYPGGLLFDK